MKKFNTFLGLTGMIAVLAMIVSCTGQNGIEQNVSNYTGVIKGKVIYQEGVTDCSGINVYLEKLDSKGRSASISESTEKGRATNVFFASTVTAKDGSYSFSELADGNYTVYASNGDEAAYISTTVTEGRTATVDDLKLVLKGSISGSLQVTGGKAAGSIVGIAGTSYIAFVAEDGSFTISGVPVGKHKLCVMTNGKYQAFPADYSIDGKTTANAGVLKVTIEDGEQTEGVSSFVTATATDRGIYFTGTIPSNIKYYNDYYATNANCTINITDTDNNIMMVCDEWSLYTDVWGLWNMTYPLVNKGEEYTFKVRVFWRNWTYYQEEITITADGGLGEYKIINADKYKVELTKDRVVQFTGKPEFTKNDNVIIKRSGVVYSVYKYKEEPSDYLSGNWVFGTTVYGDYDTIPLKDAKYLLSWSSGFDYIDAVLSGNWYGIRGRTKLEIAGYSDDDNVYFEMNDDSYEYGQWGGERKKVLVVYGYSKEDQIVSTIEFSGTTENGSWEVTGLPGEKHGNYPYSEVYDFDDTIYEPKILPKVTLKGIDEEYRFERWNNITFNSRLDSLSEIIEVDGEKYFVRYIYANFVPVKTYTVTFMLNDGKETVYETKRISTEKSNDNYYSGWNRFENIKSLIKSPERKGFVFDGWYTDKECTKLLDPNAYVSENITVYAGWIQLYTATLMDGEKKIGTEVYKEGGNLQTIPETKDGMVFDGWYLDADYTKRFDTSICKDVILYARWINKHEITSNELIRFNIKNAKYLATQWAKATNIGSKGSEAYDSLIALVPEIDADGNPVTDYNGDVILEEVKAIEVPKEELKLADWCVPQPVREVYTCPYSEVEPEAKGVYTVFACYIDWWKYTDGTPAPGISMVMYLKPDGTTVDVLNIDGNVKYFLTTWIKENDGEDYLQFDENGNLFMLAYDEVKYEFVVFRYNPLNDRVDTYRLNLGTKSTVEIRNFTVTKDGKYVFLNVMVNGLKNNVYVMPVNSGAVPVALYEYEPETEPTEPTWAVSTISFNPLTNNVYWYVDEYNDPLRKTSGLYVARKTSKGYTKDEVTRHAAIGYFDFINVVETKVSGNADGTIPKPANPDYKAVIDYLMNAGGYDRSKYQFDLSYFKDKTAVTIVDWEGCEGVIDFSKLYEKAIDDTGKNLTDEDAVNFLVNSSYKDVYGYPEWYDKDDPNTVNDPNYKWVEEGVISSVLTNNFFMSYWCQPYDEPVKDEQGNYEKDAEGNIKTDHVKSGAGGYAKAGYSLPFSADGFYIQPVFPFDIFIHDKDGKSFGDGTIDEIYLKSKLSRNYNGIILSNDDGTWLLNDVWSARTDDNDYALAFKLTDKNGNFVCTQPDGLDNLQFKPRWSKDNEREETDPWYKKPFATNSKGIAALKKGGKTIYYHSGNETVDLLKNYTGPKLSFIYSFNLYEDTLVCNGVKENGGYIMLSIDLSSGKITKLPLEKKVESMLKL